jgi:hypothetical protein
VEEAFLGASGEPVLNDKGWAKHTRRYDDKNALVEEAYFGIDGKLGRVDEFTICATFPPERLLRRKRDVCTFTAHG